MLVGLLISIPYCLLAGWDWHYPLVAMVAPVFFLMWIVFGSLAGHIYTRRDQGRWPVRFSWGSRQQGEFLSLSRIVFWGWTVIGLLPIIFHWGAKLFAMLGHESAASLINSYRYASLPYTLGALVILLWLWFITRAVCGAMKHGWTKLTAFLRRPRDPQDETPTA